MHQGPFTCTEWRVGLNPRNAWKSNPGTFISADRAATSRRSSRRKMRGCIFTSIRLVRPLSQSSASPLFLKVLITVDVSKPLTKVNYGGSGSHTRPHSTEAFVDLGRHPRAPRSGEPGIH